MTSTAGSTIHNGGRSTWRLAPTRERPYPGCLPLLPRRGRETGRAARGRSVSINLLDQSTDYGNNRAITMISDSCGQISPPQMLERDRASVKRGQQRAIVVEHSYGAGSGKKRVAVEEAGKLLGQAARVFELREARGAGEDRPPLPPRVGHRLCQGAWQQVVEVLPVARIAGLQELVHDDGRVRLR